MTAQEILTQYEKAVWITRTGARQKRYFDLWKAQRPRLMSFDTETTGVVFGVPSVLHTFDDEPDIEYPGPRVFGISLALDLGNKIALLWARINTPLYKESLALLKYNAVKVAHNARYDLRMSQIERIDINGDLDCTLTMSRIVYDRRKKHSLQALTEFLCPELSDWEVEVDRELTRLRNRYTRAGHPPGYVNYSFLPDELVAKYSPTDSFMCLMLYKHLKEQIENDYHQLYARERKVYYIINEVEKRGLPFDSRKAKREARKLLTETKKLTKRMQRLVGYDLNPNAPQKVLGALKALGVNKKLLTLKGKQTTGADVLRRAAELTSEKKAKNFIKILLDYRAISKQVSTYLLPLAERAEQNDGIILTSINPNDTRTSRMASRDPNLQNIPEVIKRQTERYSPVRSCFTVRDGYTNYYFDYSQMELAFFGILTGEERILTPYANGDDIHGYMANYIYGEGHSKSQRDCTKNMNYGKIFGLGVRTMALMYQMSEAEAKEHSRKYDNEFTSIRQFHYQCKTELEQFGYVEDLFGKRYHVPVRESYKAVNALVQGGCAQIFKSALLQISNFIEQFSGIHILLPVHDEFILEKKDGGIKEEGFVNGVIAQMVDIDELNRTGLRLRVDVKKSRSSWAEKESIKI